MGADSNMAPSATSACRMKFNSMCYARGRKHRMNSPGGKPSMNAPCARHVVTTAPRKEGREGRKGERHVALRSKFRNMAPKTSNE